MADLAGNCATIRGTTTEDIGGGVDLLHPQIATNTSLTIKVTSYEIDFECKINRILTSGTILPTSPANPPDPISWGVVCAFTSSVETKGGVLRGMGFVDPSVTAVQAILCLCWIKSYGLNMKNVVVYLDQYANTNFVAGNRKGFNFGIDPSLTPTNNNLAKLIPIRLTGKTDDAGMQEIEFELHSMNGSLIYANNL